MTEISPQQASGCLTELKYIVLTDLHADRVANMEAPAQFAVDIALDDVVPVLHVDNEGHLIPVEKVRGRRQSLDALVKHMGKTAQLENAKTVFLSHGDAQQDADYVAAQIQEKFPGTKIYINMIGPVIGAHSGPGTIALFFMADNKD